MADNFTVLLVDDDLECRRHYGTALREAGFGVLEAGTGEECLRLAAGEPSVVVMDVRLPDIDGYEVCRRIKKHPAMSTIPVLHFSPVFHSAEDRTLSLEGGADGNLLKPAPPEELLAQVRALFRGREGERRFRTAANQWKVAFDATSDVICLLDIAGNVVRCNKAMADLLGLGFTDIIGRSGVHLVRRALSTNTVPNLTHVHHTGRRECVEFPAGGRWFHLAADPVAGGGGEVEGSVQVFTDITEFKNADDERLRLLTERALLADHLKLLLESTSEGICGVDRDGMITFINHAGAAMCGYEPLDLIGESFHERLYHSRIDGEPILETECCVRLSMTQNEGRRVSSEVLWRRDGTWFFAEYAVNPINVDGGVRGAVVTFCDISERKHWDRVLIESQKLEAVGRLAAGLAHDFNNLIAAIVGNSAILLKACPDQHPDRPTLEAIEQAAWRAEEVVRRLVTFSRQSRVKLNPVDLRKITREVDILLRRLLDRRIAFDVESLGDLWPVLADAGQISQVIINLLLNARDAMPDGGRLILRTENVIVDARRARRLGADAAPGEFVRVSVIDSGHGIPMDVQPRIFEPFFSTKERGKGTGLGLAVVFGIVRQHGGWITFDSEEKMGTRFDVYLPRSVGRKA